MIDDVRLLDELCARGWPAAEIEEADGWLLRANAGVSLRANSVWARTTTGGADVEQRIDGAERFYRARGLPPHFQISPASEPGDLEAVLARRGYAAHTTTDVMVAEVGAIPVTADVELRDTADDTWRQVMVANAADADDARGRLAIIDSIPLPRRHALLRRNDEPAGIGVGVLDGEWLGIFAMRTSPNHRRQGVARAVVGALMAWAAGARHAYLQVEADNAPAIALYRCLGFERRYAYRYWSPPDSVRR